jgi:hypothetical protein
MTGMCERRPEQWAMTITNITIVTPGPSSDLGDACNGASLVFDHAGTHTPAAVLHPTQVS